MLTLAHANGLDSAWSFDVGPILLAAIAVALYAQAFVRLRRRSPQHANWTHAVPFLGGAAVSVLAVISPLDGIGEEELLTVHMLQHLLLGDVGPILLVLGTRGPLALFLLPPPVLRVVARSPLRAIASFLMRPLVSLGFWLFTLGFWHVPSVYDAAIDHSALHALEHACFALAGILAWTQILDPARRARLSVGQRALFAFTMLVASSVLAEVLVATHPLYPHYAEPDERPFGWTAGQDQSKAAVLMMAEQIATLGTAMIFLVRAHVERVSAELPG